MRCMTPTKTGTSQPKLQTASNKAHIRVVFPDSITRTVERALAISNRIQHTPSERQNERYDQDKDTLERCLEDVLDLMNEKASVG